MVCVDGDGCVLDVVVVCFSGDVVFDVYVCVVVVGWCFVVLLDYL